MVRRSSCPAGSPSSPTPARCSASRPTGTVRRPGGPARRAGRRRFADRAGALLRRRLRGSSAAGATTCVDTDGRVVPGHAQQRRPSSATVTRAWRTRCTGSCGGSTPTPVSTTPPSWSSPSGSRPCCPTRSTPSSSSTPAPRRWIWPFGSPWAATGRRDVVARAARRTTAGPTLATPSPPRRPTTPTPWPPARVGAHRALAQPLPRPAPRRRGAPLRPRGRRAVIAELAASGRPPAAFICEPFYGNAGGMALPDGYLAAGLRRGPRATAAWPSPTRCRSATAAWATGSGASSSRASSPTSSLWPRRWATATRSAP